MSQIAKVVIINGEEYILFEEAKPEPIEFRVYYDDKGKVSFYTCEKPEGNYLIIDRQTFVEARPDMKVIDGKLVRDLPGTIIQKLIPSIKGISCAEGDISIVVDETYENKQKWDILVYELQ